MDADDGPIPGKVKLRHGDSRLAKAKEDAIQSGMLIGRLAAVLLGAGLVVSAWAKEAKWILPVPIHAPLPVYPAESFNFSGVGGVDAFRVDEGRQKNVPEEFRIDTPAQPKTTVFAVHPFPQAIMNKGGSAEVRFVVGPKGNVLLTEIVSASEPEFGWAAATAAQRWRFEPPTKGGKPVEVKVVIPFKFEPAEPEAN